MKKKKIIIEDKEIKPVEEIKEIKKTALELLNEAHTLINDVFSEKETIEDQVTLNRIRGAIIWQEKKKAKENV